MNTAYPLSFAAALMVFALGCNESHSPDKEQSKPATTSPEDKPASGGPTVTAPSEPDEGDRPPAVTAPPGLPEPDPACPDAAPEPGTRCTIEVGSALSCAWDTGSTGIARCACVAKQDDPPDAQTLWNCDEGPSGEGPSVSTCPQSRPETGTPCSDRGSSCAYSTPSFARCKCDYEKATWNCEGNTGFPAAR